MSLYTDITPPYIHLRGDGVTSEFAAPFSFITSTGISVWVDGVEQQLNNDYLIYSSEEDMFAGKAIVTIHVPPPRDVDVTLIRKTVTNRVTDFEHAANFQPRYLDSEFDNYLYMLQDNAIYLKSTPHFNPKDIGKINGLLPPSKAGDILRINEDNTGFTLLGLTEIPELNVLVERAEEAEKNAKVSETNAKESEINAKNSETKAGQSEFNAKAAYMGCVEENDSAKAYADMSAQSKGHAETSATNARMSAQRADLSSQQASLNAQRSEDFSVESETSKEASVSASTISEAAKDTSVSSATRSGNYAMFPEDQKIPHTSDYSAYHWAQKAMKSATSAMLTGGVFEPKPSEEYPSVTGLTQDKFWLISAESPYTYRTGDLAGRRAKSQDSLVYVHDTDTWWLLSAPSDETRSRKITYGFEDPPTTGYTPEEGEIYIQLI